MMAQRLGFGQEVEVVVISPHEVGSAELGAAEQAEPHEQILKSCPGRDDVRTAETVRRVGQSRCLRSFDRMVVCRMVV